MSWLSKGLKKLGKGAKKLVSDPGDWLGSIGSQALKAAPIIGGAMLIPGVGGALGSALGLGGGAAAASGGGALSGGLFGGAGGLAGSALGGLKAVGKGLGGLDGLLGIASGIQGYDSQRKANRYTDKLLQMAEQRHAETAGLRSRGLAGLSKPDALPDVSSLFASDAQNPYSNRFKKVGTAGRAA